ncbi:MAG: flavin reductase [Spirochaetales bacterium]|nr:flavin reductase [Spirochaetales bacterium]
MGEFIVSNAESAPLDMLLKPFSSIGHDWMLITAGRSVERGEWNTMTASWGSFGVFWNRRVITCVIRPTRHTYSFVEKADLITFSFFHPEMKKALQVCGSTSGATVDKAQEASLTPLLLEPDAVGFNEARLNIVCRKIYAQDIDPHLFIDAQIDTNYPQKDYHRMYLCEILRVYQEEKKT